MEGYCSVCGKRLGMFASYGDLKDGSICADCIKLAGFNFNNDEDITLLENMTAENVISKINFIEENRFRPNTVSGNLAFDDDKMVLQLKQNGYEYYYAYDEIVSFEYLKDDKPEVMGGVGGAILGSALLGPIGLVGGALIGSGVLGKYVNSLAVRFVTNDRGIRTHTVTLLNERVREDSEEFQKAEQEAYKIISAFENAVNMAKNYANSSKEEPVRSTPAESKQEQKQPEVKKPTSIADEILRYKELLDCGAITKEEFDALKKKLLGL